MGERLQKIKILQEKAMGRFEEFELSVRKIGDYPLIFEALIPGECNFFQDVRRYQSTTTHLNVQIIDINGQIHLEQDMTQVPMSKLSSSEKKEFLEYLKLRITRGDNIGSSWIFFRNSQQKQITAYGANIVFKDAKKGQEKAKELLTVLQKNVINSASVIKLFTTLLIVALLGYCGCFLYTKVYLEKKVLVNKIIALPDSPEMKFYQNVFPDIYSWKTGEEPFKKAIGKKLLNPEFIRDIITCMGKDYYREQGSNNDYRIVRTTLFIYFNYNLHVIDSIKKYKAKLAGTEFHRLSQIYSCVKSDFSSNIFYFKVGDLALKNSEILQYFKKNMISFHDYKKMRDSEEFSEMLEKDIINFKLKNFLKNIYTATPLKIKMPIKGINWYLAVKTDSNDQLKFAAFFKREKPTLVPQNTGDALLKEQEEQSLYSWYKINHSQAAELNLSAESNIYFTEKMGQALKLEIISKKIKELGLEKIKGFFPVSVHRELLMEDSKGKYGIQCDDPVTSLVVSNLLNKFSFKESRNITLKRDPIQFNTSLIQLSKDISHSTQAINITPGKTGLIELFKNRDSFKATLANGKIVRFEKAERNLFNPFSFMVHSESITFNFKHDITGMEFALEDKTLGIFKSDDGGHEIIYKN